LITSLCKCSGEKEEFLPSKSASAVTPEEHEIIKNPTLHQAITLIDGCKTYVVCVVAGVTGSEPCRAISDFRILDDSVEEAFFMRFF
jgi:hypothetical protein